ncbi:MAG: hypothetical protein ACRDI0_07745 [Actinomycetota bacterium]
MREIAESLHAGLGLAWLLAEWVALHVALGALAIARVALLVVRPRPPRPD